MSRSVRFGVYCLLCVCIVAPLSVWGQTESNPAAKTVKLFDGIQRGQLVVHVVPQSYFLTSIRIKNVSSEPLHVVMPEVFAAVATKRLATLQTLARNRGSDTLELGGNYDPGGSQSLGGSFYYRQPGQVDESVIAGGAPKPRVLEFTLLPSKTTSFQVPSFCMEFGKPDPNPKIAYTLVPLDVVTKSRAIRSVLIEYGKGKYHQAIAQLAMWHVANGASWADLSRVQWPGRLGRVTPQQLLAARELAEQVQRSPGESHAGR